MKTFFSTFAALLCAAAVIWAARYYLEKQERDQQTNLRILETRVNISKLTAYRIALTGIINHDDQKLALNAPAEFAKFANYRLPRDATAARLHAEMKGYYTEAIGEVRKRGNGAGAWGEPDPSSLAWADEMEKRLR